MLGTSGYACSAAAAACSAAIAADTSRIATIKRTAASLAASSIATTAALRDRVSTYNNAASRANSNAVDAANAAACVRSATTTRLAVCLRARRRGNATCFFVAAADFTMSCGLSSGSEEDASDEDDTPLRNKSYYFSLPLSWISKDKGIQNCPSMQSYQNLESAKFRLSQDLNRVGRILL